MAELSTIARPYAEALFELAKSSETSLASWLGVLEEMAAVSALDDVAEVLADPRLDNRQRADVFAGLLKSPLDAQAQNFIEMLVDNERMNVLPQIAEQFEALKNQLEGTARADITSAYALDDESVQTLVAALEHKFGLKIKPVVTIDPELIGGVRVVVGDQVLDTSVQAQLARMRDTLAA